MLTKIYCLLLLLGMGCALRAADEQQLALSLRAQSDFDRVAHASGQELPDATRCEQSQAAWLTIAPAGDLTQAHFRKGYCALAAALVTRQEEDFRAAAAEFDNALKTWPEHVSRTHNQAPETLSTAVRLLAPIARLEAATAAGGADVPHPDLALLDQARHEISSALDHPVCPASFLPAAACDSVIRTGHLWLGWIALEKDDLYEASRDLSGQSSSAWAHWVSGKQGFRDREYGAAAREYGKAAEIWKDAQQDTSAALAERLAPRPDLPLAFSDWGGAQMLSGDADSAIHTLDIAVKSAPNPARALFLRARAEELAGRTEAALADYSMASRTAFAHAENLASGEAHLYRGILLYRRKDYVHAENEFASALNFEIPAALRPDAMAWRHMAAVTQGACSSDRAALEESLAEVSPYFPKAEARTVAASCPLTTSAVTGGAI